MTKKLTTQLLRNLCAILPLLVAIKLRQLISLRSLSVTPLQSIPKIKLIKRIAQFESTK